MKKNVFSIITAISVCTPVCSAWDVKPSGNGIEISIADIQGSSAAPYFIEKASSRYSAYERVGKTDNNTFVDTNGKMSDYYRIVDSNGNVADTISFEQALFGDRIYIFSPSDNIDTLSSRLKEIDARQFGREMSPDRYALLFREGDYRNAGLVNIPFYVHIAGLGSTPYQVKISNIHTPPHLSDGNGTCTFWRSVENLSVIGPETYDEPETFKWAVSQAAPMRRVYSTRTLRTQWENGWVSGGYAADCRFDAPAGSDHQQQWYYRNSILSKGRGEFREEKYNYCFQGVEIGPGADASAYTDNWHTGGNVTMVDASPVIREKPFLCVGDDGRFKVFRPAIRHNAKGLSYTEDSPGEGIFIDLLENFDVIKPGTSSADMNRSLASGRSLLITPGMYTLDEPLRISNPGTIVLGIGWATLVPGENNREGAMVIDDVDDVVVASILFDAHYSSDTLLKAGDTKTGKPHTENPVVLSDLFFRVGGFKPNPVHVDKAVEINSNNVIGDHFWIWRADHGVRNSVGWDINTAPYGLVVNGDDVTLYALFNEHFQKYQTLWNGENGRTYFYQCETPYDAPSQADYMSENGSRNGYAAYKVADNVKNHYAAAMGIYDVLVNEIMIENSVEVPDTPGVNIHHVCNNSLSNGARRGFRYVINGSGKSTYDTYRDNLVRVVDLHDGK